MSNRPSHTPVDVLDKSSLALMNLNVVKRIDPETEQLLATAGHVALYDYDQVNVKWSHKGIEGTLFLIKRRTQPYHQFIVLNKKSQDHYVEDIHDTFKFENSEREGRSYLLYKSRRGEVVGIWFYDKQECSKVVALLEGIATDARKIGASLSPGPTPKPTGASQKSHPLLAAMQRKAGDFQAVSTPPPSRKYWRFRITLNILKEETAVQDATNSFSTPVRSTEGEESFWDSRTTAPTSDAALLQPDGKKRTQSASEAVPQLSSQPGLGAPASGKKPPAAEMNALQKLFGSMQGPLSSGGSSPPQAGGGQVSSPQVKGLAPFNNSAATPQTPVVTRSSSGGIAATPLSAFSTPLSTQRTASDAAPTASAPPGQALPSQSGLLKPRFFQQTSTPAAATTPQDIPEPGSVPTGAAAEGPFSTGGGRQPGGQDAFSKMFAPKPSAAVFAEPLANSSANGHPQNPPVQSNRALVKGALKLLAESDDLVQVIVQELEKSGLLTKPASP